MTAQQHFEQWSRLKFGTIVGLEELTLAQVFEWATALTKRLADKVEELEDDLNDAKGKECDETHLDDASFEDLMVEVSGYINVEKMPNFDNLSNQSKLEAFLNNTANFI